VNQKPPVINAERQLKDIVVIKRRKMSRKKTVLVQKSNRIVFAPTNPDRAALTVIEGYLARLYGRKRLEITNAECIRYCLTEQVKVINGTK
jgi:hypothetical protein